MGIFTHIYLPIIQKLLKFLIIVASWYVSTNKKSVLSSRQILPHSSTPETSSRVTLASLCIAFQATNIEAAFLASGRRYFCNRGCRSVLRSSALASSAYHASQDIMHPRISCIPGYHASQAITHPRLSRIPGYHASQAYHASSGYAIHTKKETLRCNVSAKK